MCRMCYGLCQRRTEMIKMINLTADNYFSTVANQNFMSVSQFKAFEKCHASALAEINGEYEREQTIPMLVGSYVDAHFDGTLQKFITENASKILKKDGSLKSEFIQAKQIISRIEKDKMMMEYMSGKQQVIMTGTINGVAIKIMIDHLHDDKIVDRKIVKDFAPIYAEDKGLVPWFEAWEYDLQGAVYQEIVRQNTGNKLPFYLGAATKEKITDLDIVHITQDYLDFAMERFTRDVEFYDAIKKGIIQPERCDKCEYCKGSKILTEPTKAEDYYLL